MIDTPQVAHIPAQHVAALHLETSRAGIREVMGPGIQEAMAAARAQGLGPTGPWFAHHRKITPVGFDFDICVPVSAPVQPVGRVRPAERAALRVVRTVYRGPYEGLGEAWHSFDTWCREQGVQTAADLYETYLVGPEASPDPAQWQTEFCRALVAP